MKLEGMESVGKGRPEGRDPVGNGRGTLGGKDWVGNGTLEGKPEGTPAGRLEGRDPVGKPGEEMRMMLKFSPRTVEIILESGPMIWERMVSVSTPPAPVASDRIKPRPMERGDCPTTTVTFTLVPGPRRPSRTVGMSCWRMVDRSPPEPMVTLMLRGPIPMRSRSAMMLLRLRPAIVLLRSRPSMMLLRLRPAMVVLRSRPGTVLLRLRLANMSKESPAP